MLAIVTPDNEISMRENGKQTLIAADRILTEHDVALILDTYLARESQPEAWKRLGKDYRLDVRHVKVEVNKGENMKLTKGTILKASGGWDAEVVWIEVRDTFYDDKDGSLLISSLKPDRYFYAVHKPGIEAAESHPICHASNGHVRTTFSVGEAPSYNGHPADLEMGEYEL